MYSPHVLALYSVEPKQSRGGRPFGEMWKDAPESVPGSDFVAELFLTQVFNQIGRGNSACRI